MKRIIQPEKREIAAYFCDKHPDRECFSQLDLYSWYGSIYDTTGMKIHLCDQCVDEMKRLFVKEFGVKTEDITI